MNQSQSTKLTGIFTDDKPKWTQSRRCKICKVRKHLDEFIAKRPLARGTRTMVCTECEEVRISEVYEEGDKARAAVLELTGRTEPLRECSFCDWGDYIESNRCCPICGAPYSRDVLPTKEEIRQRCAAIRERWGPERLRRDEGVTEVTVPTYSARPEGRQSRKMSHR